MKRNRNPRPTLTPRPGAPAGRRHGPDALRAYWGRWTAVVELYALGRQGRRRVDPRAYQELHRLLIDVCQDLNRSGDPMPHDYQKIEAFVRPWMSPKVLAQTDRELLSDLLGRCRQIERELGGRRRAALRLLWNSVPFVAALVASSWLAWYARGALFAAADTLRGWSATAGLAIGRATAFETSFVLGLVLVLTSISIVSRAARS